MEKLVLDRLIAEIEKTGKAAERQLDNLRDTHFAVVKERDRLRTVASDAQKAQLPFSDLFRAADAVVKAKTPAARKAAISKLILAMCAAEKHIDWIPF